MVNVSDAQRQALHAQFAEKIGVEVADSLTRSDLDMLRLEMQAMESRLRTELHEGLATQTRWFMASQLVLVGAFIGSITTIAH